ncbi:ATP-binding protein [Nocardiopsis sp. L17-MgMaSL7]|uniref:ATP-binding protein n=1 Tax=Nocardiopsis sp. L17-MgMaSL7 TaxID=1938893 RepID=UPI000D717EA6|nr:ATP-binding protein [Nocardiopsis sp. L17-MgMaSL7]PWV58027.1 anti-sigma regulatory factor (Ser/Thr protein kinase) [Nocardiopsis sp. L17-MgMaSL7]
MAIVPHPHAPDHTITPPGSEPRWQSRVYPGQLSHTRQVRADLDTDLNRLLTLPVEARENMVLCVSEMFANACDHSRSGQEPEGRVVRTLDTPRPGAVRISVIDDGTRTDAVSNSSPTVPRRRTRKEWDQAERGRGLLLLGHLVNRWGFRPVLDFPFCAGLGTVFWAEFTLPVLNCGGASAGGGAL